MSALKSIFPPHFGCLLLTSLKYPFVSAWPVLTNAMCRSGSSTSQTLHSKAREILGLMGCTEKIDETSQYEMAGAVYVMASSWLFECKTFQICFFRLCLLIFLAPSYCTDKIFLRQLEVPSLIKFYVSGITLTFLDYFCMCSGSFARHESWTVLLLYLYCFCGGWFWSKVSC